MPIKTLITLIAAIAISTIMVFVYTQQSAMKAQDKGASVTSEAIHNHTPVSPKLPSADDPNYEILLTKICTPDDVEKNYPGASPEEREITCLYKERQGRYPENEGLNYWMDQTKHMSLDEIKKAFFNSSEYQNKHP